jgi:hypothetical protein
LAKQNIYNLRHRIQKAKTSKAIQGNTMQSSMQYNSRQYKTIQGNTRQFKASQGNSKQFKAIQGITRQFKASQEG